MRPWRGVFTTFRTFGGGRQALALTEHLLRLQANAQHYLGAVVPVAALRASLATALPPAGTAKGGEDSVMKLRVDEEGKVTAETRSLLPPPAGGAVVRMCPYQRPAPSLKYLTAAYAHFQSPDHDETFFHHGGRVTEGNVSNVFFRRGQTVTTAPSQTVLSGVMRGLVLRALPRMGYRVEVECLRVADLRMVDEIFYTNAVRLITPVRELQLSECAAHIALGDFSLSKKLQTYLAELPKQDLPLR